MSAARDPALAVAVAAAADRLLEAGRAAINAELRMLLNEGHAGVVVVTAAISGTATLLRDALLSARHTYDDEVIVEIAGDVLDRIEDAVAQGLEDGEGDEGGAGISAPMAGAMVQ